MEELSGRLGTFHVPICWMVPVQLLVPLLDSKVAIFQFWRSCGDGERTLSWSL